MKRITDVRVNHDACLAHWACSIAPRVFLDRGDPWPVLPENLSSMLESDRDEIIEAAMSCPMAAISVEFADGRIITSEDYDKDLGLRQWLDY
jgi:ferredoxin